MSTMNIIRAWKDVDYRNSLSASERASLPPHPAGLIELADADGARGIIPATVIWKCCDPFRFSLSW